MPVIFAAPTYGFSPQWSVFKLGAGGQITAVHSYSDGTMLARTDTMGAYVRVTSGNATYGATSYAAPAWQQVVTPTSIPSFSIDQANGDGGVLEIVAAPSNTNVLYMLWNFKFWVSTDKGSSWTQITGVANTHSANDGNYKATSSWIAVDPNTPSTVFVATTSGVSKVTSATTTPSVSAIASIPGTAAIAYAQGSSTHLLAAVRGGGSVYESTDGATFSVTASSPTTTQPQLIADKFGQFFLADAGNATNSLYKYASSTWSTLNTAIGGNGACACVAANPNSAAVGTNQIIVANNEAEVSISNDNGATWTGAPAAPIAFSASAPQPIWLNNANQGNFTFQLNGFSIAFDNTSSNLWFAGGLGLWKTPTPVASSATPWVADTLGVEQLVELLTLTPPGGWPIVGVWDKGFFTQKNPDSFPSNYYLNDVTIPAITFGWSVDYAATDPTCIVGWQVDQSATPHGAISTNGGNTFSAWTTQPSSTVVTIQGGWISALSSQKWLLAPALGKPLQYTTNAAATAWSASTVPGSPTNWTGWGVGYPIAADRVAADTYLAVTTTQSFYKSTDAGANFTAVATSSNIDGTANAFMVRSMPGQSNTFFYTAGGQSAPHPAASHLWKTTDIGATWSKAPSSGALQEVVAFGFGAAKSGSSFSTIYAYGWLSSTLGFYQSIDGGGTWSAINVPASQSMWPLNSADLVVWVDGDPDVYGRINVGFRGSGGCYIDTADAIPWVKFSNINPHDNLTGTVTLTAQHSGLVTVSGVQFQVDGVQIGATQTGQSSYSVSWNTGGVAVGSHTLSIVTSGGNGTATTQSIPITTH